MHHSWQQVTGITLETFKREEMSVLQQLHRGKVAFFKNYSSAEWSVYILYAPFSKSVTVISLMSVNELHLIQSPRSLDLWMKKWLRQREARSVPTPWQRRTWVSEHNVFAIFLDPLYLHTQLGKHTLTFKKHPSWKFPPCFHFVLNERQLLSMTNSAG